MDVKGTIYTLKMQNSQNYVLSAGDRRVLEIVHNQEAGGWKWAIGSAAYTIVLAWNVAFIVYLIALLFPI